MKIFSISAYLLLFVLASCSGMSPNTPPASMSKNVKIGKPYSINGMDFTPSFDPHYDETGLGSWYGPGFHGKRTASGETFDQNDLTAAHPTLPMPSLVRVTNLKNNKSLVVRVNDRGPFHPGRIIDLSKAAAMQIALLSTMPVRVEYLAAETEEYWAQMELNIPQDVQFTRKEPYTPLGVDTLVTEVESRDLAPAVPVIEAAPEPVVLSQNSDAPAESQRPLMAAPELYASPAATPRPVAKSLNTTPLASGYYVQAGSFSFEENANKLVGKLSPLGKVTVSPFDVGGKPFWRVRVGPAAGEGAANEMQQKIDRMGIAGAKVVRVE